MDEWGKLFRNTENQNLHYSFINFLEKKKKERKKGALSRGGGGER